MRGHQYTAAHHASMFRTWTEFDAFTEDLKVFGTNQVELAHFTGSAFDIDGGALLRAVVVDFKCVSRSEDLECVETHFTRLQIL